MTAIFGPTPPTETASADDGRSARRIGYGLIAAFFGVFGGWAAFAPLEAGVVAPGVVVVAGNRQTVQHRDGGIVSAIYVKEGDRVRRGDILIALATPEVVSREEALRGEVVELASLRARLLSEQTGTAKLAEPALFADLAPENRAAADAVLKRHARELQTRRSALNDQSGILRTRQDQLRSSIAGLESQIASIDEQLALIDQEIVGVRTLAEKGLAPLTRLRALQRGKSDLMGRRGGLQADIAAAQGQISETGLRITALRSDRDQGTAGDLRTTEVRLTELLPQWKAAKAELDRALIRAPTDGAVVGLAVHTVNGVVAAGARLMDIVPNDQPMVVEAQVRPDQADDVVQGMSARVRFSAFDHRTTPIVDGTVRRVSADRFVEDRTGGSYFLIMVEVPKAEVAKAVAAQPGGEQGILRAGLPVEVMVPTRSRTALDYMIEPLVSIVWRSFREQ